MSTWSNSRVLSKWCNITEDRWDQAMNVPSILSMTRMITLQRSLKKREWTQEMSTWAGCLLTKSDPSRYEELVSDLQNLYARNKDQYPNNLTDV